jgi:pimeloyl-ACP methyl ester carboxylesterase
MHLDCAGDRHGATVVIEGGAGAPSPLYRPLRDRIAGFARACAYDRAGIGWSDPPAQPRDFDTRAKELHELLKRAGERPPFIIAAHSQGGLVARRFAALFPREVAGLVLIDSLEEGWVFAPAGKKYATQTVAVMESLAARREARPERSPGGGPQLAGLPSELAAQVGALATASYYRTVAAENRAVLETSEDMARTAGFGSLGDLPLLVIRRGRPESGMNAVLEPGWPEAQARLLSLSTRSRALIAERSGHMVMLDEPDLVAGAVRDLLNELHHPSQNVRSPE